MAPARDGSLGFLQTSNYNDRMIFQRALQRELASVAGATFTALFTVFVTWTLISILGKAAGGKVASSDVLALIGFSVLNYLPTIIILTSFIAVIVTVTRSYRDSEMVVWFASGQSLMRWVPPVLVFGLPMVAIVAVLSFVARPWAKMKSAEFVERFEKREAEKAFNAAFAAFRGEDLTVLKDKARGSGPLQGQKYATLHAFVQATKEALSKHGLSVSWKVTRDEPEWIEVTCVLKHKFGHFEAVAMGGPPDNGPARNALQARHSTVSYLERYTLKAICGLAEQDDDDDGAGGASQASLQEVWVGKATLAQSVDEMMGISKDGTAAFNKARDKEGYKVFAVAVQKRGAELRAQEAKRA